MRSRLAVPVLVAAALAAACGGGGDAPEVITGRVVSIDVEAGEYCVSPDRGETETCVQIPDARAVEGVDVGECVETTPGLTGEDGRVEVVAEAACAAGDLGD